MKEKLVFNKKEHKLEELIKYGFYYDKTNDGEEIYTFNKNKIYIDILKSDFSVSLDNDDDGYYNDGTINNIIMCLVYDLIKDGLIIKEKE